MLGLATIGVDNGTDLPGFFLFPDAIDMDFRVTLERFLRRLDYEHAPYGPRSRGSSVSLRRGYAQFGWQYHAGGALRSGPDPLPDLIVEVIRRVQPLIPAATFDQAVAMHYPPGADLGWHVDGKRFGPIVVALSFAGEAVLEFRPNDADAVSHRFTIPPGALYWMGGASRWEYHHRILPVLKDRFSITLRQRSPE